MGNNNFSGNIGEWSEVYVLLRLLADGKLVAARSDDQSAGNLFFPLIKITRDEGTDKKLEFVVDHKNNHIKIFENNEFLKSLSNLEFQEEADRLYVEMNTPHDKPSFPLKHTEDFVVSIGCNSIKAPSNDKTDITLWVHDPQTGYEFSSGFSIKSQVGHASTLLNAGKSTNFIYEVCGLNNLQVDTVNAMDGRSKIKDRMQSIFSLANSVSYIDMENKTFKNNLMLIDSKMPEIVSHALIIHYRDNIKKIRDVVDVLEQENPLDFPSNGFYQYKMKKFLCAVALGLQPATAWDGRAEANGGYIVVTPEGEVKAYHIYNRDSFEEYLFDGTKFDRGSTTRHDFASLYKFDKDELYLKLNLQIRF